MIRDERYRNGQLIERWDVASRTYTRWDASGAVVESRPFTAAENTRAAAEEAAQALSAAQTELDRAVLLASAPTELAAVQQLTLQTQGISEGAPWRQPTGAHDAYPVGYVVTHNNKTWESTTPANVWQPGVSGWREIVAEGYAAWIQPTGAHDAYKIGDRVSFNGSNYESLINANTWSPTAYPAGWKKL